MRELIERIGAIAAEIDAVHGPGTAARDAAGTFAVGLAGCVLVALTFIVTGG